MLIAMAVGTAFAQGSQGSVAGVVKDASGAAIAGATVTLKNVGTNDVRTTTTSSEGGYVFNLVNNGTYTVSVSMQGFATSSYSDIKVLPGQQYSLNPVLKVGGASEIVDVVAGQEIVNTTTSEIAGSVTQQQILNLPLLGRNPIELMRNQAGVPGILAANREDTGINGGRPGWTQVTQDGINIQDNFIRNNATDFVPARPTSDTIGEFSVITSNVGSDSVGGASQVKLVTPSGTNEFHGGLYEYNRNSALSAYNFFSKRVSPLPKKPFLNLNQFGGKLGGPVLKNKLFFWGSYEGFREAQQQLQNLTIPAHADYLTGTYRYGSNATAVNVLNMINANLAARRAAGLTAPPDLVINPKLQNDVISKFPLTANSLSCGDSTSTLLRNTTCDSFNQGHPTTRTQVSFRVDYNLTDKHTLQLNYQRFWDSDARTDIDNVTRSAAVSSLSTKNTLWSGAWRWTITPRLLNEFRAGEYTSKVPFLRNLPVPSYLLFQTSGGTATNNSAALLSGIGLTNVQTNFLDQGRDVDTRQFMDNATYSFGNHNLQFGTNYQKVMPHPYNYAGILPNITFGFTAGTAYAPYLLVKNACANPTDVNTQSCNPGGAAGTPAGAAQTDINAMNAYAAFLAGAITSVSQTYQAQDLKSGFVNGYPNKRNFSYSIFHYYGKDTWRLSKSLSLTLGLKYEYWTPISVDKSLGLLPVINGNDVGAAMLGGNGSVVPFSRLWQPDRNQFAPSFGVAWSINDKTVIRGGYSLTYVNEDSVTAAQNALNGNFGLVGAVNQVNLASTFAGAPTVPVPTFNPYRSYTDQLRDSGVTAAAFAIDPHLRTPSAHQVTFGIQRELPWSTAVEARYVGTFSRDLWRGVDYNQQNAASNAAFFADFQRARSNYLQCGSAEANATGAAPAGCAAGQALTYFPTLDKAGDLTNATILSYISTGQIGLLADYYVQRPTTYPNTRLSILPNSNIYGADAIINGGILNYNSMQLEVRHRTRAGLSFQANYTFSKDLSDTYGDSQNRFEPLLDNNRPGLNYSRSPFDINHAFNANFVYDLPFGRGRQFFNGVPNVLDKIIGGWQFSSIVRWQTGSPFSFISGYATYQRRATDVTAYSPLSVAQIKKLLGVRTINNVTYFIDPKVIGSNGKAVGTDGLDYTASFTGQVFFNPLPGQFGSFKKLQFSGPSVTSWDATIRKSVKFGESHPIAATFASDFFNATNSQFYYVGDQNINSTSFGRLTSRGLGNRVVQMSLRVDF